MAMKPLTMYVMNMLPLTFSWSSQAVKACKRKRSSGCDSGGAVPVQRRWHEGVSRMMSFHCYVHTHHVSVGNSANGKTAVAAAMRSAAGAPLRWRRA
jgi:hypothetical protein